MAKRYKDDVKRQAKIMWLSGNYKSDKAIAAALGLSRSETIKDWRLSENWEAERQATAHEARRTRSTRARMSRRSSRTSASALRFPTSTTARGTTTCPTSSSA